VLSLGHTRLPEPLFGVRRHHAQLSAPLIPSTAVSSEGMASRTLLICSRSVSRIEVVDSMPLMAESRCVLMVARLLLTELNSVHEDALG
jgi:hypothetical protein